MSPTIASINSCTSLFFCLSFSPTLSLSVSLPLPLSASLSLSLFLSYPISLCLSASPSLCLSLSLPLSISLSLSPTLSLSPSISLCLVLSFYLSSLFLSLPLYINIYICVLTIINIFHSLVEGDSNSDMWAREMKFSPDGQTLVISAADKSGTYVHY